MRSLRQIASAIRNRVTPQRPVSRLKDVVYNDAPQIERLVFIGGLHRSGTTLLENLLCSRYEFSCLRADVAESEGQFLQSVFSAARVFGGPGRFAFNDAMLAELRGLTDHGACRARILLDWRRFVVGEAPTLLEKSPPNLTKIWWLRQVFPGSRFIVMVRDPRAVSAATLKWARTSLPELMMHWNAAYSLAMADFRDEDCTLVRYEDLIARPEEEIARLGSFCGVPPRRNAGVVDERHAEMRNANDKYVQMHGNMHYGAGIWDRFGYAV
jgi:Sulfotransferase family